MKLFTFAATVVIALSISTAAVAECDEVKVLALNIYHEARGEGPVGMQMVGEVTLNRVEHPAYPDTICDVVYQRKQFSWTSAKKNQNPKEKEIWSEALQIAEGLINDEIGRFDNGATHFLNPDAVKKPPVWVNKLDKIGKIGKHVFYRL